MPRPRVDPSHRRRVSAACSFCRATKRKCSGTAPCTNCSRRGLESSCRFLINHSPTPRIAGTHGLGPTLTSASDAGAMHVWQLAEAEESHSRPSDTITDPTLCMSLPPLSPSQPTEQPDVQSSLDTTETATTHELRDHMVLDSHGERVYIGDVGSISFLQLIREIVSDSLGPSQFSPHGESAKMFETETPTPGAISAVSAAMPMTTDEKLLYAQIFYSATGGILYLFSFSEIEALLLEPSNEASYSTSPEKPAVLDLIVAIGAQCKSTASAQEIGRPLFQKAQQSSFAKMLENPTLDLVRDFLLMAFYLMGECRRNSSYTYLGIAVRTAVSLGLHKRNSYASLNKVDSQLRLRTWMSLCVLDMFVSVLLGRPSATTALCLDSVDVASDLSTSPQDDEAIACLTRSYRVLKIISAVVGELYEKRAVSSSQVEQYLHDIEQWRLQYPESFARPRRASEGKSLISTLHVSSPPANGSSTGFELASASIEASVYLVESCVECYQANLLLGNMCIIKALLFPAGLILGFDMFASRNTGNEVETAFRSARDILCHFSVMSPLAAHYLEILTMLSSAISKKRETTALRRGNRYVSRIQTSVLSAEEPSQDPWQQKQVHNAPTLPGEGTAFPANGDGTEMMATQQQPSQPLEFDAAFFFAWDNPDILQWDNFLV